VADLTAKPSRVSYEYGVIRVVPQVEREEFINVGVILHCRGRDFLAAGIGLEPARLSALCPTIDPDWVQRHLESIVRICAGGPDGGPVGALPMKERFHWLTAPRSTVIQVSPVHSGLCEDPAATLEHLMQRLVRPLPAGP
jgi:hypothetical protein